MEMRFQQSSHVFVLLFWSHINLWFLTTLHKLISNGFEVQQLLFSFAHCLFPMSPRRFCSKLFLTLVINFTSRSWFLVSLLFSAPHVNSFSASCFHGSLLSGRSNVFCQMFLEGWHVWDSSSSTAFSCESCNLAALSAGKSRKQTQTVWDAGMHHASGEPAGGRRRQTLIDIWTSTINWPTRLSPSSVAGLVNRAICFFVHTVCLISTQGMICHSAEPSLASFSMSYSCRGLQ